MIILHVRLFMVIAHVTIFADSALCFEAAILGVIFGLMFFYKQNNTTVLGQYQVLNDIA